MPERIVGSYRNHPDRAVWPHMDALTSMVRDLQHIDCVRDRYASLDISRQEGRRPPCIQEQDDRIIVLIIPARDPIRRRMQNVERTDRLTRRHPSNGNLLLLNAFDQFPVSWNHWITPQPEFADLEVFDHVEEAIHMIVVRVSQDDGIQPPDASREQIWRDDALANRECAFVAQFEEPPGCDATSIDQHAVAGREFDQGGIALSYVEKRQGYEIRRLRRKIFESYQHVQRKNRRHAAGAQSHRSSPDG